MDIDRLIAFGRVIASRLSEESQAVLLDLRALAATLDDADAERSVEESVFGQLGVVANPLPADDKGAAETLSLRLEDGIPVFAARDLRVTKARGYAAPGSASLAGYGGAFVGVDVAASGTGDAVTAYVPYEHDSGEHGTGTAAKAHVLSMDSASGAEAVLLVHGDGHGLVLTKDGKAVLKNKTGNAFIGVQDDGVILAGDLKLTNNLLVGNTPLAQDVALAEPLIAFVAVAGPIVALLANAINTLAPGTIPAGDITALNAAVALYLTPEAPPAPEAPLTRSSKIKGEPG